MIVEEEEEKEKEEEEEREAPKRRKKTRESPKPSAKPLTRQLNAIVWGPHIVAFQVFPAVEKLISAVPGSSTLPRVIACDALKAGWWFKGQSSVANMGNDPLENLVKHR